VFLCLSAWLFAWRKRNLVPVVSFSLLWFFLTIFPVSNLAYPLGIYMASRYLYLPILGFCLLLPYLLYRCGGSSKASSQSVLIKRQISLLLLVLLLFYATRTFLGNALWKSNLVLWQKISSRYPQNGQAHKILGDNLRNSGATKRAIYEYKQAISLNPGLVDAYNQLGVISGDNRDYRQAIIYFKQAVLADPGYLCSYNNLAVTYARSGDLQKAEKIWKKMLFFDPKNKDARGNLRKLKQLGK
jgi:pentatricopeptide repeat protein